MKFEDFSNSISESKNVTFSSKQTMVKPQFMQQTQQMQYVDYDLLQENLNHCLEIIDDEVMKGYVTHLHELPVIPPDKNKLAQLPSMQFFKITELVYQENEFFIHKLATVFKTLSTKPCTLSLVLSSDGNKNNLYLGVRSKSHKYSSATMKDLLCHSFEGIFAGSTTQDFYTDEMNAKLNTTMHNCISSVTCVADFKQEKNDIDNNMYVQSLEKFVYSMQGRAYTAIFISDNLSTDDLIQKRKDYENIYTQISPFVSMQYSFSKSDTQTTSDSNTQSHTSGSSEGITSGISKNVSSTQNFSLGLNETSGNTQSVGFNSSQANGNTDTYGKTEGISSSESKSISNSTGVGFGFPGISGVHENVSVSNSRSETKSDTVSFSNSISQTLTHGMNVSNSQNTSIGKNQNISLGTSYADGIQKSETKTLSSSVNIANTRLFSDTFGQNQGIVFNATNKALSDTLKKLDRQLERIDECESLGTWNFAAYFLGESAAESETAASTYYSLISGAKSGVERSAVNSWHDENSIDDIYYYIKNFSHPCFEYTGFSYDDARKVIVDPSIMVSTNELAIHMGLPRYSIKGLPVVEHSIFAQEVLTIQNGEKNLKLGNIYHLGKEIDTDVNLDINSLAMHTFITGSTGSGKSNTIYSIIDKLAFNYNNNNNNVKFMVIEPTKGEYKNVFGHKVGVSVFGTNTNYTKLLKINPFKFPKEIHVLEHIDRLIEIFNVCWDMYAAMPAVLKDAILQAYKSCGWDLSYSKNSISDDLFPTFQDILDELHNVIEKSSYSQEVKSNYSGSLTTRVSSLTNGLNGQIFSSNEIDNEVLFDSNVIIDLSRIGSQETKSLIMGILIMRLSEYRMSNYTQANSDLKHITVLEEAHNILSKTSSISSNVEGSNIAAKSVEMISNAIAEMRTYGEGFIIADQSPGAVDISAIRNTNTKIIMRLPEENDRRIAGKAAAMKDKQIDEIAKLSRGVAVVYQNDWIEPVLSKIDKFNYSEQNNTSFQIDTISDNRPLILDNIIKKYTGDDLSLNINQLSQLILKTDIKTSAKIKAIKAIQMNGCCSIKDISSCVYDLSYNQLAENEAEQAESIKEWKDCFICTNDSILSSLNEYQQNVAVECILREQIERYGKNPEYLKIWNEFMSSEDVM